MDFAVGWIVSTLRATLPPSIADPLAHNILSPSSPLHTVLAKANAVLATLTMHLYTVLAPLLDRLAAMLASSPDVVVILLLLGLIVATLQIISFAKRIVMFWTRMLFRLLFWTGLVLFVSWAYQRGLEVTARDLMVVVSRLVGFGMGVKDFFMSEWSRYSEMERAKGREFRFQEQGTRGRY